MLQIIVFILYLVYGFVFDRLGSDIYFMVYYKPLEDKNVIGIFEDLCGGKLYQTNASNVRFCCQINIYNTYCQNTFFWYF